MPLAPSSPAWNRGVLLTPFVTARLCFSSKANGLPQESTEPLDPHPLWWVTQWHPKSYVQSTSPLLPASPASWTAQRRGLPPGAGPWVEAGPGQLPGLQPRAQVQRLLRASRLKGRSRADPHLQEAVQVTTQTASFTAPGPAPSIREHGPRGPGLPPSISISKCLRIISARPFHSLPLSFLFEQNVFKHPLSPWPGLKGPEMLV